MPSQDQITQLLAQCSNGNKDALDQLMPFVYDELRRLARRSLAAEGRDHTLQTTALVNEAYLRLVGQQQVRWQNRAHFFAIAARLIRRILVDHARTKQRDKRGGGAQRIQLDEGLAVGNERDTDLIALDVALEELARLDPRKCDIVEMKFFGGLSAEEIGEVLGVSAVTVMRDWSFARGWLYRELSRPGVS